LLIRLGFSALVITVIFGADRRLASVSESRPLQLQVLWELAGRIARLLQGHNADR